MKLAHLPLPGAGAPQSGNIPQKKRRRHRLACSLLAVLVLFTCIAAPASAETPAEKYKRLQEELAQTRQQIQDLKNNVSAARQLMEALEAEKVIIDEMVEVNKQEITRVEGELDQKQQEIAETEKNIYDNDQLLRKRLVAVYNMNSTSMLSQLFSVDSLSDFFIMMDTMRRISRHDTDLLDYLAGEQQRMERERADIDSMLKQLEEYHAELLENQAALAQNIADADASLSQAQAQLAAQQEIEGDQYAAMIAAQKEMEAIANNAGGSTKGDGSEFVGGAFIRPIANGIGYVSCEFGQPDPNGKPHRGMDIACASGTTIMACGDGTVVTSASAHNSYGNYIIIDHGNGVKSLYAHCTSLLVGAGTQVAQGQAIATVGTTGFVTGAHLHWEVLDNNVPTNPRNW